jgi:hypothetical protein
MQIDGLLYPGQATAVTEESVAKRRRRRQQYQPRSIKQPAGESTRPVAPASDETLPQAPAPPVSNILNTGMPISVPNVGALPSDNLQPEEQGYARGGAVALSPMPGYSDYTAMKTDPVARRRYSPRHVGFAKGGPIAPAPVPAYTDPVYPAPSPANAALYADMAALRARAVNPPSPGGGGQGGPPPQFQTAGEYQAGIAPHEWSGVTSPLPGVAIGGGGGGGGGNSVFDTYWNKTLNDRMRMRGYAEGGEVLDNGAPDAEGYLRGDNAMSPEELDAALQQIAQLDPNQGEDAVNLTAIVQAAQSGDMDRAASILAGFRRRFDSLNAHAQGAAAHGDLNVAAALAGKAHSQVPDGLTVNYAVAPDGSGVTATVSPSGQTFQMNGQQFHDYLVGPATSFDHILENGLEKNLAIASGSQDNGATGFGVGGASLSLAGPPPPVVGGPPPPAALAPPAALPPEPARPPTGYAEGGEVTDRWEDRLAAGRAVAEAGYAKLPKDLPDEIKKYFDRTRTIASYQEGGEVEDDYRREDRPTADRPSRVQDPADDPGVVRRVLNRTREMFGFGAGDDTPRPLSERIPTGRGGSVARPSKEDIAPVTVEPRVGLTPLPRPPSGRGGVDPAARVPLPGEDILIGPGGPASSARTGVTRPVAAPAPQQLGARDEEIPAAATPTAGLTTTGQRTEAPAMRPHPVSPQADPIPVEPGRSDVQYVSPDRQFPGGSVVDGAGRQMSRQEFDRVRTAGPPTAAQPSADLTRGWGDQRPNVPKVGQERSTFNPDLSSAQEAEIRQQITVLRASRYPEQRQQANVLEQQLFATPGRKQQQDQHTLTVGETATMNIYEKQRQALLKYMTDQGVTDPAKVPSTYQIHPDVQRAALEIFRRRAPVQGEAAPGGAQAPASVTTGWARGPGGGWINPAFPGQRFDDKGQPIR